MCLDVTLRGLSYGVIGLLLLTGLVPVLVSIRKEARRDKPLSGLFRVSQFILGFRVFVGIFSACQSAKSLDKLVPRLQTETVKV